VATKYILAALSAVFIFMGGFGVFRDRGRLLSQSRTWLLIGVIFGAVSAWLFHQG